MIQGKAGMQFMGDWAKGEFTAAGQTPGKEYGCTVLGDHGIAYVMGGDVFVFPQLKDASQAKAQQLLARVLLEPDTQIKFAQKKGSIPVRLDIDTSSLDACARKASGWIHDANAQVPANEMLSPPALTGADPGPDLAILERPERDDRCIHHQGREHADAAVLNRRAECASAHACPRTWHLRRRC